MIPFISSTSYSLFGITFQTWGTLVGIGFLVGTWIAARRAARLKLKSDVVWDAALWIFIAAFIGARLFHVIFYDPTTFLAHPISILDPRVPGYAMFGGFLGAAAAFFWMMRRRSLDWVAYADALIWGLPWGCGIGRIGCFLIHDHPGTLTSFALGVKYPDGQVRHDLGLYLSIIGFATGIFFLWLNRKKRAPGFWFGTFMVIEGLSRFFLDFLRVADVRYFGLTPTQYLAVPLLALGVWMMRRPPCTSKNASAKV